MGVTPALPFDLRCLGCGRHRPPTLDVACDACGGLFEVAYRDALSATSPRLPLLRPEERLTLGEGGTPLVELRRTGEELGLEHLWVKLEFLSPTGSFKDRGSSILMSIARELGAREFVEDSSGNAGASLAAYAAAAGMRAHVFAPQSAPPAKLAQIAVYGAELHPTPGPRPAAGESARAFAAARGLPYLSHCWSPFFSEGMKPFAWEAAVSAAGAADHVICPVGNGSLLIGAERGFRELREAGSAGSRPRLHAVQAAAVCPVAAALHGRPWSFDPGARTIAGGIAVSDPPRLQQAVAAIRGSGGDAVTVDDGAILEWQRRLARTEGIFCEPTSAAAFAGLAALLESGTIERGERVLVPVTGSGLKEAARA